MKTGFQIAKLVYKAKQGKLTEEEQAVLEEWMAEGEGHRRLVERICGEEYWEGQWAEHHAYDVERGWRRFRREVRALEARRRLVRWGSVAAGIAVVAGAVLFVAERKGTAPAVMPVVEAVEPGRSVAVLTLADGSRMVLGDTLRASLQESGAEIRIEGDRLGYAGADSVASGRQNKVSTPRGGEFRITLGDGTQVWLNPGTELSFDRSFNTDERNVSLSGEAYFDVYHNPGCPFIVTTESFRIKVLGTVFNVRNFPGDRNPDVSLAQGSVAMQNLDGVNLVRLRPGQQAVFDTEEESLEINDIYVGDMLMRHYGAVSLKAATIREIVSEISEMYGVKIVTDGEDKGATYNFSFQKDSNVGDILDMLEFVCKDMKFSIE